MESQQPDRAVSLASKGKPSLRTLGMRPDRAEKECRDMAADQLLLWAAFRSTYDHAVPNSLLIAEPINAEGREVMRRLRAYDAERNSKVPNARV